MEESKSSADQVTERLTERVTELEAKIALSEDMLDELNRTVYRQQELIDRLQQVLRALQVAIEGSAAGESMTPRDETPPHY